MNGSSGHSEARQELRRSAQHAEKYEHNVPCSVGRCSTDLRTALLKDSQCCSYHQLPTHAPPTCSATQALNSRRCRDHPRTAAAARGRHPLTVMSCSWMFGCHWTLDSQVGCASWRSGALITAATLAVDTSSTTVDTILTIYRATSAGTGDPPRHARAARARGGGRRATATCCSLHY